ncbi:E3 ubiquitin-protein ligase RING1-like [Bidens hawaiensis]|uniref:E3 ubiquitin-protein ligase RING1-like n=1 Tax=Bidens hawaiensis TaxID=980011 RepID=UPI0040499E48
MSNLHRKTLRITIHDLCKPKDDCHDDDHQHNSFRPRKLVMICALVATFGFVCYIIVTKLCSARRHRTRRMIIINTNPNANVNANETPHDQDLINEDHEPEVFHPIWLINTVGLERSVIDSIKVFKYRKEDGVIDSDCPVCLGVFQDDDRLRLLPKCSHAFHVECIDTWLRSHKNCPLCRAPVVVSVGQSDRNSVELSVEEGIRIREIDTNGGVRVQSDLTNSCSRKLEPMRRSVSMGLACFVDPSVERRGSGSRASVYGRGTKSSSFGPRIELEGI